MQNGKKTTHELRARGMQPPTHARLTRHTTPAGKQIKRSQQAAVTKSEALACQQTDKMHATSQQRRFATKGTEILKL